MSLQTGPWKNDREAMEDHDGMDATLDEKQNLRYEAPAADNEEIFSIYVTLRSRSR
jgi:hypothetical protein